MLKRCSWCKEYKTLSCFTRDKYQPDGLNNQCKLCRKVNHRPRPYNKEYSKKRDQTPERRQSKRDAQKKYKSTTKGRETEQKYKQKRRALLHNVATDEGISISALREIHGDLCCFCGEIMLFIGQTMEEKPHPLKATHEHLTPITRGGSNTWDNSDLAHLVCNIKKGKKTLEEWLDNL